MRTRTGTLRVVIGALAAGTLCTASLTVSTAAGASQHADDAPRAALKPGEIQHVMVIDLENEDFAATFGATSPATYLNNTLLTQGELVENYYATSHVSLGNYVAQVSGQAPTADINNDCIDIPSLFKPPTTGRFTTITPGTPATDQSTFPGCHDGSSSTLSPGSTVDCCTACPRRARLS